MGDIIICKFCNKDHGKLEWPEIAFCLYDQTGSLAELLRRTVVYVDMELRKEIIDILKKYDES